MNTEITDDRERKAAARRSRFRRPRRSPNWAGLGLVTLAGTGIIAWVSFFGSWGYASVILVPLALGLLVGLLLPVQWLRAVVLPIIVLVFVILGAFAVQSVGALCSIILLLVFFLPFVLGVALGFGADHLTSARRERLRSMLVLGGPLVFLALWIEPIIVGRQPVEIVRTARVIPVDVASAWERLQFYEEVRHEPPWLARVGLPRPLYTKGSIAQVGDVKTCVWDKGRLVKRVTKREPPHELAFDVIEQVGIEARSARLIEGSFRFEPLGPSRTRIVLTTRYEPLLTARLVWRPFERAIAHALHEHVLEGIERDTVPARPIVAPFDPSMITMNDTGR